MVSRPSLPAALIGLGVVLLLVSALPVGGSPSGVSYVHEVRPAEDGTLLHGIEYEESDVLAYENLSERERTVFDRARRDSPYVVDDESATAPEFTYTSDHVAIGEGLYPVRYEDETYSLRTERASGGFNAARLVVSLLASAFRLLGGAFVVAGLGLAGWRRYRGG